MRKRKWKRQITLMLTIPLVKLLLFILWRTCRVTKIIGVENMTTVLRTNKPFIPCYWHQRHIFCARYILDQKRRGLKLGFLISPSADGEIAASIIQSWGAVAIRGSTTRTGAKAMRDLYETVSRQGISPVTTSDGPTGPAQIFKPGAVMLSQLTQVPMLPLAYASSRAWQLKSWDQFLIPKPFSRIVIAIGPAMQAEKRVPMAELEPIREAMEKSLNDLIIQAEQALQQPS